VPKLKKATEGYFFLRGNNQVPTYVRHVPLELRDLIGAKQLYRRLPDDHDEARKQARALKQQHDRMFAAMRSGKVSKLIQQATTEEVERHEGGVYGVSDLGLFRHMLDSYREVADSAISNPGWRGDLAARLMEDDSLTKAQIAAILRSAEQMTTTAIDQVAKLGPVIAVLDPPDAAVVPALSEVAADWLTDTQPPKLTRAKYELVMRRVREVLGNPEITAIDKKAVWRFRDAIAGLPRSAASPGEPKLPVTMRSATVPALLDWMTAHPKHPNVLPAVVRLHLAAFKAMLGWAVKRDLIPSNPASGVEAPEDRRDEAETHHGALPWQQVPSFMAALRQHMTERARALQFVILTGMRTDAVLRASWLEIEPTAKVWTVPAARMKGSRKPHRVPLSDRAIEVLGTPGEGRVFRLPQDALRTFLKTDMQRRDIVPHGFRSTFRDWAAEATQHDPTAAKIALAHSVGSKVDKAYLRSDMLEKRRVMMEDWTAFCMSGAVEKRKPD
jgi:integrase